MLFSKRCTDPNQGFIRDKSAINSTREVTGWNLVGPSKKSGDMLHFHDNVFKRIADWSRRERFHMRWNIIYKVAENGFINNECWLIDWTSFWYSKPRYGEWKVLETLCSVSFPGGVHGGVGWSRVESGGEADHNHPQLSGSDSQIDWRDFFTDDFP